jgi:hypothetical protein
VFLAAIYIPPRAISTAALSELYDVITRTRQLILMLPSSLLANLTTAT